MNNCMLRGFFTVVYFLVSLFLINLIFRNTLSVLTDIMAVICWIIAFFASVGLAEYTVKKIRKNYQK